MVKFIEELKALLEKSKPVKADEPICRPPIDTIGQSKLGSLPGGDKITDADVLHTKEMAKELMAKIAKLSGTQDTFAPMSEAVDEADRVGENVFAVGCDCDNDHKKTAIIGIHPKIMEKLKEGNDLMIDFESMGIPMRVCICTGKDYLTTMSNVAAVSHKEPGQFAMTAPGKERKGKLFPYIKMPENFGIDEKGEVNIDKLVQDSLDIVNNRKNTEKPNINEEAIVLHGPWGPKKTLH